MRSKTLFLCLAALLLFNFTLITASVALAENQVRVESTEYYAESWIELLYTQSNSSQFFIDEKTGNALPSWSGTSTNYQIAQPNFSGNAQAVLSPNFNMSYSSNSSVAWPGTITEPVTVNTGSDATFYVDFYSESTEVPITFDYNIVINSERLPIPFNPAAYDVADACADFIGELYALPSGAYITGLSFQECVSVVGYYPPLSDSKSVQRSFSGILSLPDLSSKYRLRLLFGVNSWSYSGSGLNSIASAEMEISNFQFPMIPPNQSNQPPTTPVLSSPADGATGTDPDNVVLEWQPSSDPENDQIHYCVHVEEAATENDIYVSCDEGPIYGTSLNLSDANLDNPLEPGKTYRWRVEAEDENFNESEFSEWWTFTTAPSQPNQPPEIVSFTADPDCNPDPFTVCFTCTAQDLNNDIAQYNFDFGDGIQWFNETRTISHTYTQLRSYKATCTVVDRAGNQSPPKEIYFTLNRDAKIYGLFVGGRTWREGILTGPDLRGDLMVKDLANNFRNLTNVAYTKVLFSDNIWVPIAESQVQKAINEIKQLIQPGDIFVMYIVGHGDSAWDGDETTLSPGDEYIFLGVPWDLDTYTINDDELTSWLSDMGDNVEKWVFLDACHAGGFWGNHNPNDQGDLEKLHDISMIAAAAEDKPMHWIEEVSPQHPWAGDLGKPIFGMALREAWSKGTDGKFESDLNKDDIVTFQELSSWLENTQNYYGWVDGVWTNFMDGIVVREGGFGDESIYSSDMWNPVSQKSDDFVGVLLTDTPDSPSANAGGPYSGEAGLPITFDASGSSTPNQSIVLYEWDWENDGVFDESTDQPTITHTWHELYDGTVRLRITDNQGLTEIDSASVDVIDTTPPNLTLTVSPNTLWPPNHKLVPLAVTVSATDNADPDPVVALKSITMNEGEKTNTFDPNYDATVGEGNTTGDIQVDAGGNIYLRAERSGTGSGRVYTITYTATDASGNTASTSATVTVPHNQ
jgi:hypothetical protein